MNSEQREAKRVYDAAYHTTHGDEIRARHNAYYQDHREEAAAHNAAYRESNRDPILEEYAEFSEWLQILRTTNGCEDCGTHGGWLEHHHTDPSTKTYSITQMHGASLDTLEGELGKCVILCRPCHKKRHAEMRSF